MQARETHAQRPFSRRDHDEMTDKSQEVWSTEKEQRGPGTR